MKTALTIVGSLIVAVSFLPYLADTIKNKVRPRIASWMTWALITGTATVAAISEGAYSSAVLTGIATVVELLILYFALKHGDKNYGLLDGICQSVSVLGIIAWIVSKDPAWAIAFNILADFFAAIPTYYHGWVAPHEEAWQSFILFGSGSFLAIFAASKYDLVNLGFPVYLTVSALSIGLLILIRQKTVPATA